MLIYFVNLARASDRRDRFLSQNGSFADFERFDAVDGTKLNVAELMDQGIVAEQLELFTPRSYGSAMSHLTLWDRCIDAGQPITVAEDDALFNCHFVDQSTELIAGLPDDWEIIRWGWNFDSILDIDLIPGLKNGLLMSNPVPLGAQALAFQKADYHVMPFRLRHAFGLICYTVSPRGARALKQACFPLRNEVLVNPGFKRKILSSCLDVTMNKYYQQLQAYVCFPPLVWAENQKAPSDPTTRW